MPGHTFRFGFVARTLAPGELGLGAGWLRAEYEEAGIRYAAAGTRIERLAEAVALIKGVLADERVTFVGRHYTTTDLEGRPGVQRPRPPILSRMRRRSRRS